jgi:hypothetical protein
MFNGILSNTDLEDGSSSQKYSHHYTSGTMHNLKQHELIQTAVEMTAEQYSFSLQETMDQASVTLL